MIPEPYGGPVAEIALDGTVIVRGDVDISNVEDLDAAIARREAALTLHGGPLDLVLEVGEVTFIDSSALRILLDAARRARSRNGRVVLCNIPSLVAAVLAGTSTTHVFVARGASAEFPKVGDHSSPNRRRDA